VNGEVLVERALSLAHSDAIVLVESTSAANVRWAGNSLTTNGLGTTYRVTVIATADSGDGVRVGAVTRAGVTESGLADLVAAAEATAAGQAEPAEDAAPLITAPGTPDFGAPAPTCAPADLAGVAAALGDVFGRANSASVELFGYAECDLTTTWLGSSTGLRRRHVQPTARVDMTAKSHNRTRSTWSGVNAQTLAEVDVVDLYDQLSQRLQWQSRSVQTDPGRCPVILSPSAMADLMVYLYWTADARDAAEGRTVFSRSGGGTRLGETLSPRALRIWSDPTDVEVGCLPFVAAESSGPGQSVFDNGMALGPTDWVHDGRLATLWGSRYSAGLAGQPCRPPIDNLLIADRDGQGDLDDLIARTEDALLINSLWYMREVDPPTLLVTGLTRDGVYRVRDGEVVGATSNYRFNESPVGILNRITDVGSSGRTMCREWGDWFTRVTAPPVAVSDFHLSTRSQAS
jgi:predicted Zn-dependent protease